MAMPIQRQRMETETIGGVTVVYFLDERIVADDVIEDLGDQLVALVEDRGFRKIVLNFGNVKALSSTALAKLFVLRQKLNTVKGALKLCCIHAELLEVFQLHRPKGAPPLFEIFGEEQQAIDSFGPPARRSAR
jgi:anti-sigma B factor antagonist